MEFLAGETPGQKRDINRSLKKQVLTLVYAYARGSPGFLDRSSLQSFLSFFLFSLLFSLRYSFRSCRLDVTVRITGCRFRQRVWIGYLPMWNTHSANCLSHGCYHAIPLSFRCTFYTHHPTMHQFTTLSKPRSHVCVNACMFIYASTNKCMFKWVT